MDHDAGASAVKQPQNKLATFQSSDNNKELQKWLQQEVNNKIAKKLYRIIPDIDAHIVPNTGNETYDFPKVSNSLLCLSQTAIVICLSLTLNSTVHFSVPPPHQPAGSHLNPSNPALEFSKAVCHIISLDPTLEAEVTQLKKVRTVQHCQLQPVVLCLHAFTNSLAHSFSFFRTFFESYGCGNSLRKQNL
jgi:hypothetical protein